MKLHVAPRKKLFSIRSISMKLCALQYHKNSNSEKILLSSEQYFMPPLKKWTISLNQLNSAPWSYMGTHAAMYVADLVLCTAVFTLHSFLLDSLAPQWEPIKLVSQEWPWALASAPSGTAANQPGVHTPSQEQACTTSPMPATPTVLDTLL